MFQKKNIRLKNVHKTIISQTDINHISSNMSYRYDRSSNDGCVMIFVRVQFLSKLLTKVYFRSDIKGLFVALTLPNQNGFPLVLIANLYKAISMF